MDAADHRKVALVRGATLNVGHDILRGLYRGGYQVVVVAPEEERTAVARLARRWSRQGLSLVVAPPAGANSGEAQKTITFVAENVGRLDACVLCPALLADRPLPHVDATVWDETLAQLTTLFTYGQAAVGWFLHKNQPGQLVCLTGRRPSSGEALGESHQALAAGGITALVRSMALELQHTGIRINGVELGVTAPNPSQPGATPSRAYRRDNVAALVEFFTSAAAQNLTGQIVGIDGQHLWLRRNQETAGLVQRDGPWTAEAVATSWARLTR